MVNATYNPVEVGKRLKKLRKANQMTQEVLAEKLSVTVDSVSKYENGHVALGHDHITRLCVLFHVSADYFYFGLERNLPEAADDAEGLQQFITSLDEQDKQRALEILKLVFVEKR